MYFCSDSAFIPGPMPQRKHQRPESVLPPGLANGPPAPAVVAALLAAAAAAAEPVQGDRQLPKHLGVMCLDASQNSRNQPLHQRPRQSTCELSECIVLRPDVLQICSGQPTYKITNERIHFGDFPLDVERH